MQKSDGQIIVEEARTWVGTRYQHQHQRKGAFVDCVGLIIGVGTAIGRLEITPAQWAPYRSYSRTPNPSKMREAMQLFLKPIDMPGNVDAPDGAIAWFKWREGLPMHLGIMASIGDRRTVIHSLQSVGRCVEHSFFGEWSNRVDSWWKYPDTVL